VGAVLLLWVIAWLALPALIKWQLPLRAGEALGRAVTIGEVSFKPWSLDLRVSDIVVAGPAPASEPLLRVKGVHVDVSAASLFKRAPVVEALEIDAPQLRVARTADGHYDIDDLIARFTPKPSTTCRCATRNCASTIGRWAVCIRSRRCSWRCRSCRTCRLKSKSPSSRAWHSR
jgi:uncharacterized protein involved in outer membrane biogenesis